MQILLTKLKKAVELTGVNTVAIAGGVSANSGIRKALKQAELNYGWQTYIPKFEYTTDNAAMIGIAAYYKYLDGQFDELSITAKARLKF